MDGGGLAGAGTAGQNHHTAGESGVDRLTLKISVLHAVLGLLFADELIPVLSCFRCAEIQDHPHTIGDVLFGDVVVLQIDKCPPAFVIGVDVVFVQQFGIGCVEVCHSNLEIGADLLP